MFICTIFTSKCIAKSSQPVLHLVNTFGINYSREIASEASPTLPISVYHLTLFLGMGTLVDGILLIGKRLVPELLHQCPVLSTRFELALHGCLQASFSIVRLKPHTLVVRECLPSGVSLLVGLDIFDNSAQMVLFSNVYTRIHKWMLKLFRGLGHLYPYDGTSQCHERVYLYIRNITLSRRV